jgi:hypothetical protein
MTEAQKAWLRLLEVWAAADDKKQFRERSNGSPLAQLGAELSVDNDQKSVRMVD